MAICGFVARSGGEGGACPPSSRRDAATGLHIATRRAGLKGAVAALSLCHVHVINRS